MSEVSLTKTVVLSVTPRGGHIFQMTLKAPPGNWADMGVLAKLRAWAPAPLGRPVLDRPFSVHKFSLEPQPMVTFLIRQVGLGTKLLSQCRPGDEVQITGPLGRGLSRVQGDILEKPLYLAAGGIGLAPVVNLPAVTLNNSVLFYGEKTSANQIDQDYLKTIMPHIKAATQDGSGYGSRGLVTDLLKQALENQKRDIIACGPKPLLAALVPLARSFAVRLWVSAEAFFGCGLGVCLSCSLPLLDGRRIRLCQEGPVVDGLLVDWEKA
jgi:dihydroorotate dehydrogenase electron transfer subunit